MVLILNQLTVKDRSFNFLISIIFKIRNGKTASSTTSYNHQLHRHIFVLPTNMSRTINLFYLKERLDYNKLSNNIKISNSMPQFKRAPTGYP